MLSKYVLYSGTLKAKVLTF